MSSRPSSAGAVLAVPRNAPCPCGSGRKYKRCCMERDLAALPARRAPRWPKVAGFALLSIGIGIAVGVWRTPPDGVAAALAVLMVAGGWWSVKHAPRSSGRDGDPGGATIDFGRNGGGAGRRPSRYERRHR